MNLQYTISVALITFSLFVSYTDMIAQGTNFSYNNIDLLANYFVSPDKTASHTGWIVIRKDDNSGNISDSISTTTWTNYGINNPAAYVSGNTGRVGADIDICTMTDLEISTIWIAGLGTDGYDLPMMPAVKQSNNRIRYESQPFTKPFPINKVGFWEDFEITWLVSNDQSLPFDQWLEVGKSTNPLYVTHDNPLTGLVPWAWETTINFIEIGT